MIYCLICIFFYVTYMIFITLSDLCILLGSDNFCFFLLPILNHLILLFLSQSLFHCGGCRSISLDVGLWALSLLYYCRASANSHLCGFFNTDWLDKLFMAQTRHSFLLGLSGLFCFFPPLLWHCEYSSRTSGDFGIHFSGILDSIGQSADIIYT